MRSFFLDSSSITRVWKTRELPNQYCGLLCQRRSKTPQYFASSPLSRTPRNPPPPDSLYKGNIFIILNQDFLAMNFLLEIRIRSICKLPSEPKPPVIHQPPDSLFKAEFSFISRELRGSPGRGFEHRSTWGFEHANNWEENTIKPIVTYDPHSLGPLSSL